MLEATVRRLETELGYWLDLDVAFRGDERPRRMRFGVGTLADDLITNPPEEREVLAVMIRDDGSLRVARPNL